MLQQKKRTMYYKKEIIERLKKDTGLRLRVALALGVGEQAIKNAIKRNGKSITNISAVNVIKEYTGLSEEEIFETEKV